MKRRMLGTVVAAIALTVVPSASASAQGAQCMDVTITQSPPGWHVSETYACDGCKPLTVRPTTGGAVYTINMGCPR